MIRFLLVPLILLLSALSFLRLESYRRAHAYGWLSPDMEPHWQRLFATKWGSIQHDAKNVLSEWCRQDPQRAGKLFSFALLVVAILGVLL